MQRRIAFVGSLLVVMALSAVAVTQENPEESNDRAVVIASDEAGLIRVEGLTASNTTAGTGSAQSPTEAAVVGAVSATDARNQDTRRHDRPPVTRPPDRTEVTRPPDTATTAPPTTTTRPQSTTTTVTSPPNTTTTVTLPPSTTTTVTLPTVAPSGDVFTTLLRGNGDGVNKETNFWWDADYFRNLPYTASTGWTDGDRSGYKCFYAFLEYQGAIVGRVTFTRVEEAASYASIGDEHMKEGARYYDGTPAGPNDSRELGDCPPPTQAYAASNGVDERPTVTYNLTSGAVLEIRNYKKTVALNGITFQQVESTDQRVTIVAYKDNLPAIVVYYESMVPGVVMNSDLG